MDKPKTGRRVVFREKQRAQLETFDIPCVEDHQVLVQTKYSLMSTGTETIVFNQQFQPGTSWARYGTFPFYPGYALVGEVIEMGRQIRGFKPGDLVAARSPHASHSLHDVSSCYPLPAGMDLRSAQWFGLAKIAFIGAYQAAHRLGDTVAIIGAGPIGQMSVRWACAAGAETIIVIDPVGLRLQMALKGGATQVVSQRIEDFIAAQESNPDAQRPAIILDTTGNAQVFGHALKLAPDRGRIVLLGNPGNPGEQRLSQDILRKGLHIVGAHDRMAPDGWDNQRVSRLFFQLASTGRFDLTGLTTHEFPPEACQDAYQTASTQRSETMGILFNWCTEQLA